jgi:Cytochrome c554 and c-prime
LLSSPAFEVKPAASKMGVSEHLAGLSARRAWVAVISAVCLLACASTPPQATPYLSRRQLKDPATCKGCHASYFAQWSGSMHAYASIDPVFVAMNARGQRETSGALGNFCVKCHAPMAVADGDTDDGLNLAKLPSYDRGVTCYFCHSVKSVSGTHNNPLVLADDSVMRGDITDPMQNDAHRSEYSSLHDRNDLTSASLCGSCHDVVSPPGAAIERTFVEWKTSLFSHAPAGLACGSCHMAGSQGQVTGLPGAKTRTLHEHTFPALDVAFESFPDASTELQEIHEKLDTSTLQAALCVRHDINGAQAEVVLDNVGAGHDWPSGASQDRRAWVELVAYAGGKQIYSSGVIADGQAATASTDPDLWLIHDCMFDSTGKQVNMFWQAKSDESNLLPGPLTADQTDPNYYKTHVYWLYPRSGVLPSDPDKITMRVRVRPIGLDVIDDLIQSGDLAPSFKSKIPTFDLASTELTWTAASATVHYADGAAQVDCVTDGLPGGKSANPAPVHTRCPK